MMLLQLTVPPLFLVGWLLTRERGVASPGAVRFAAVLLWAILTVNLPTVVIHFLCSLVEKAPTAAATPRSLLFLSWLSLGALGLALVLPVVQQIAPVIGAVAVLALGQPPAARFLRVRLIHEAERSTVASLTTSLSLFPLWLPLSFGPGAQSSALVFASLCALTAALIWLAPPIVVTAVLDRGRVPVNVPG